ncbi:type II toxin-antitoxin system VapC family toxin [Haloferula sp. A504]|uniref:type II toxin-antitoxin system VapC family toxin n=1 Tax=Haloferula sp. A504 TaxID=3373601 RepID=UPI0031C25A10|nr:type II toxin-antitoxin system VapC family toxin [Verrucomicrobiaceae bacterium E54]
MKLFDVNVLVYAHREDSPDHAAYRDWLESQLDAPELCAVSELVLSGFLRVVTHPKAFRDPTPLPLALAFCERLRRHTGLHLLAPGKEHWRIFTSLCEAVGAKGNLIPDAYHAALAIEAGAIWFSTDSGFARFPLLDWRHPLRDG